jgi:hypothetical protein
LGLTQPYKTDLTIATYFGSSIGPILISNMTKLGKQIGVLSSFSFIGFYQLLLLLLLFIIISISLDFIFILLLHTSSIYWCDF